MKKILPLLLSVILLLLALAGCTQSINSNSSGQSAPSSQAQGTLPAGSQTEAQSSQSESSQPAPGNNEWQEDSPQSHGMDAQILQNLHQALLQTDIHSMVIIKDGVLVDEFYNEGYDENSVFRFNSCSKSFTSALVGIALEEGLLPSLDESIGTYFPQLLGTEKEDITIRHLLEHKSGLEWHEWTRNGESFYELNQAENWVDYVLSKPLVAAPGTYFTYTTGGTHLLAAILQQVVPGTLMEYATEHLFAPMGMDSVHWREDPQGILDGGNGIEMTARDAAKFGQLFLDGGQWKGQQLVASAWVEESTTAQEIRDGNGGSYGYQWWRRTFGTGDWDTFFAMGAMEQFIFVTPSLDMVTVFTSNTSQFFPYPYFTDYVLEACM